MRQELNLTELEPVPPGEQRYAPLLAQWHRNRDTDPAQLAEIEPYRKAVPGKLGASSLGKCSKELEYKLLGKVPSDEPDEAFYWSTGLGTLMHLAIQAEAEVRPPEGVDTLGVEVPWELDECASFADIVTDDFDTTVEVVDVKSIAPFGFKMLRHEGPKRAHVLQVAAGMKALEADRGRLVYMAQAALAGYDAQGMVQGSRETRQAEYVFDYGQVEPMLEQELERIRQIIQRVKDGGVLYRHIAGAMPAGAVIVDVGARRKDKGVWQKWVEGDDGPVMVDTGAAWPCGFCEHQSRCREALKMEAQHVDAD